VGENTNALLILFFYYLGFNVDVLNPEVGRLKIEVKGLRPLAPFLTLSSVLAIDRGLCGITVERSLATQKVAGSNLGRSASG